MRLTFVYLGVCTALLCAEKPKAAAEPRVTSINPLSFQRGQTGLAELRGVALAAARTVLVNKAGVTARILKVIQETGPKGNSTDVAQLEITVAPDTPVAAVPFRVVSAAGVTNEISLRVVDAETAAEEQPIRKTPLILNGRLATRGETDTYWIEAKAGRTVTFEAVSGFAAFDPSLTISEPSGSWFDDQRLNRIAANDEPLYFPGLSTEARLVHHFIKDGKYALQIRAFGGQGGADYAYSIRVTERETPPALLHPTAIPDWDERLFTRRMTREWIAKIYERGSAGAPEKWAETYRAVVEGAAEVPLMNGQGMVEGRLTKPAEVNVIRLRIDKPQDISIDVETPEATMPRFNPIVSLFDDRGNEIVTNVYTKRNNNGLYMMKMIQAKSTVTLRAAGEYILKIRDITTDCSGPDFAYRVLIRSQVPHVGKVDIVESQFNLERGQAKPITVNIEREEEFKGFVTVAAEGLPEGVSVVGAMANPIERPPLPNAGRLERYIGKPQTTSLMLVAAPDAKLTNMPVNVRVKVRPVVDRRVGAVIAEKELPLMIVPRRPS
ncbi:MAG: hypothetical protein IT168_03925 [Bryobacterales bacterium]|nr:hypothetical protein [Bryobacterales bacterium]